MQRGGTRGNQRNVGWGCRGKVRRYAVAGIWERVVGGVRFLERDSMGELHSLEVGVGRSVLRIRISGYFTEQKH